MTELRCVLVLAAVLSACGPRQPVPSGCGQVWSFVAYDPHTDTFEQYGTQRWSAWFSEHQSFYLNNVSEDTVYFATPGPSKFLGAFPTITLRAFGKVERCMYTRSQEGSDRLLVFHAAENPMETPREKATDFR